MAAHLSGGHTYAGDVCDRCKLITRSLYLQNKLINMAKPQSDEEDGKRLDLKTSLASYTDVMLRQAIDVVPMLIRQTLCTEVRCWSA